MPPKLSASKEKFRSSCRGICFCIDLHNRLQRSYFSWGGYMVRRV